MRNDHTSGVSDWRKRGAVRWPGKPLRFGVTLLVLAIPALTLAQDALQEPSDEPVVSTDLPSDPTALEQRGDLYMVRKYYGEAVQVYTRLTQMQPNNAVHYNKLGIAYHQMQNLGEARKAYRRAVEINPQYAQAINNLASVEYARKNYRNAILTYIRALKLNPGDAVIYGNLGTAYFAREEFEYATQSFRYALMLDPEVFRRSGRVGTIVQARDEGDPAKFNYYMAKTYAGTGNADETLQYLIKAWEAGYPDLSKAILEEKAFEFLAADPRLAQFLSLIESSGESSATTPIRQ